MADLSGSTHQLTDLTDFIRRVFALNLPQPVWIAAEIGQANESRGHTWLTLVQKKPEGEAILAQLDAVLWKTTRGKLQRAHGLKLLRNLLADGMSVRLRVTTSFHQRYGLRLVVEDIDPAHTLGELEQRRQATLQRLADEGLLAANGLLPLSPTPQRLAVISSDTAAGLADFREQLEHNPYGYRFSLQLFPAAMQGAQTGTEIAARLRQISRWGEDFDAVLIVRGGGGRTDLAAFDDEALARAVAGYPLPVITGIGHETDDAVLDRVAHTSLKTPTAAAVFLVERLLLAEGRVVQLSRSVFREARHQLYREGPRIDGIARRVRELPAHVLREAHRATNDRERLLAALRPETTLARGYALVSQKGKLITDAGDLTKGPVQIRLDKGRFTATPDPS